MTEIERLRADLEVLERYYDENYCGPNKAIRTLKDKIARLEAEADPWREAKQWIDKYRWTDYPHIKYVDHLTAKNADLQQKYDLANSTIKIATERLNEVKAENERLTKRVAFLEAGLNPPFEASESIDEAEKAIADEVEKAIMAASVDFMNGLREPSDPVLDSARVLATARQWLNDSDAPNHGNIGFRIDTYCQVAIGDAKPYPLKGANNGS